MNKIFVSLLILIAFSSCSKAFMYFVVGVRELKPESPESIIKYGDKVGYDIDNHFFYIDSSKVDEIWKGAFPKAYIYNKNGDLVRHLDCFSSGVDDLKSFYKKPLGSAPKVPDTLRILLGTDTILNIAPSFTSLPKMIHSLTKSAEFKESEYYIIYFWSKSFGRINKKNGVQMEEYIKDHPEFSTSFIKINCDYHEDWGYTKEQLKSN
jgi:hypothetical protein